MNQLIINLEALFHNYRALEDLMHRHGSQWTLVTKVLCGNTSVLDALIDFGMNTAGDSRLTNLKALKEHNADIECWYLRVPGPSAIDEVVAFSDVSLNSEIRTISALNDAAARQGRKHAVIIMIELGDLREGILPGSLIDFYESIFKMPYIEVLGIGANLGCLAGMAPNIDQFMQLILYHELLELKFNRKLPLISAASSAALPLLREASIPKGINHFRIGESLFLGTDLIHGGTLPGFRDDVFLLNTEIAELKEKNLQMPGDTASIAPFSTTTPQDNAPGQRGYRALVGVGQLDTDISGLTPLHEDYEIAGASSDLMVINVGEGRNGLRVGDNIQFRPNYAALLRLMNCRYITKTVLPARTEAE